MRQDPPPNPCTYPTHLPTHIHQPTHPPTHTHRPTQPPNPPTPKHTKQGPSWSGINYGGQWKLLHHAAKRFFAPLYLSVWQDGSDVRAAVINDLPLDVNGSLHVEAILYGGQTAQDAVSLTSVQVETPALSGASVYRAGLGGVGNAVTLGASPTQLTTSADFMLRLRFCPQTVTPLEGYPNPLGLEGTQPVSVPHALAGVESDCASTGAGNASAAADCAAAATYALGCSEALFYPVDFNLARLWGAAPGVSVTLLASSADAVLLQLSSSAVALWVTLEPPAGVPGNFNTSGFLLLPWEPQVVAFAAGPGADAVDADAFTAGLRVRSLQQSMLDYASAAPAAPASAAQGGPPSLTRSLLAALAACALASALGSGRLRL